MTAENRERGTTTLFSGHFALRGGWGWKDNDTLIEERRDQRAQRDYLL
jgi:hypothetical protein